MDFEVVWTEPATDDLEAITRYIVRHNPSAAERTAAAILKRAELLSAVPLSGSVYARVPGARIREVISGKYRIFYRVSEQSKRVEILTVRHTSRDEPEFPD